MTRSIVVCLAVLALSTSAALAAHPYHHGQATNASSHVPPAPAIWMGGVNSNDHATYLKNLHDSEYDPKSHYKNGLMRTN